jgi:hypothetical protein
VNLYLSADAHRHLARRVRRERLQRERAAQHTRSVSVAMSLSADSGNTRLTLIATRKKDCALRALEGRAALPSLLASQDDPRAAPNLPLQIVQPVINRFARIIIIYHFDRFSRRDACLILQSWQPDGNGPRESESASREMTITRARTERGNPAERRSQAYPRT